MIKHKKFWLSFTLQSFQISIPRKQQQKYSKIFNFRFTNTILRTFNNQEANYLLLRFVATKYQKKKL